MVNELSAADDCSRSLAARPLPVSYCDVAAAADCRGSAPARIGPGCIASCAVLLYVGVTPIGERKVYRPKGRRYAGGYRCVCMVFMSEGGFEIANWPHLEAWAGRLKAMPGFALPYDLIPSKDREFDPV